MIKIGKAIEKDIPELEWSSVENELIR